MKRIYFFLAFLLFCSFSSAAQAQEVLLRYNFFPEETRTYGIGIAGSGSVTVLGTTSLLETSWASSLTQTCKAVNSDGSMDIEVVASAPEFWATCDGEPLELPLPEEEEQTAAFRLYPGGQIAPIEDAEEVSSLETEFGSLLGVDLGEVLRTVRGLPLPEEPVSEGSTWENTVLVPVFENYIAELTTKSTLLGFQIVEGVDCALIQTELSMPLSISFDLLGMSGTGSLSGVVLSVLTVEQAKLIQDSGSVSIFLEFGLLEGTDEGLSLIDPSLASLFRASVEMNFSTSVFLL